MNSPVFSLGIQPTMFVDVMMEQEYLLHCIVARSRSCFHGKATVRSLFLFIGWNVVVINTALSVLPWKCNHEFPVHCCRATKYFVLLLNKSIQYWHEYVLHEGITYKSRVPLTSRMTSRLLHHTVAAMRAHNVLCNSYNTRPLLCERITCYVTVIM
jgi:hypothetical protein